MASKLLHETGPDGVSLLVSDIVFGMHWHALKQIKTWTLVAVILSYSVCCDC